jgi:hypothetical protein
MKRSHHVSFRIRDQNHPQTNVRPLGSGVNESHFTFSNFARRPTLQVLWSPPSRLVRGWWSGAMTSSLDAAGFSGGTQGARKASTTAPMHSDPWGASPAAPIDCAAVSVSGRDGTAPAGVTFCKPSLKLPMAVPTQVCERAHERTGGDR